MEQLPECEPICLTQTNNIIIRPHYYSWGPSIRCPYCRSDETWFTVGAFVEADTTDLSWVGKVQCVSCRRRIPFRIQITLTNILPKKPEPRCFDPIDDA
jgi:hypothetical protein